RIFSGAYGWSRTPYHCGAVGMVDGRRLTCATRPHHPSVATLCSTYRTTFVSVKTSTLEFGFIVTQTLPLHRNHRQRFRLAVRCNPEIASFDPLALWE